MATEEVDTNPSFDEIIGVLSGKLATREVQMAAQEIKIVKLQGALKKQAVANVRLEKKLAKLKE